VSSSRWWGAGRAGGRALPNEDEYWRANAAPVGQLCLACGGSSAAKSNSSNNKKQVFFMVDQTNIQDT